MVVASSRWLMHSFISSWVKVAAITATPASRYHVPTSGFGTTIGSGHGGHAGHPSTAVSSITFTPLPHPATGPTIGNTAPQVMGTPEVMGETHTGGWAGAAREEPRAKAGSLIQKP